MAYRDFVFDASRAGAGEYIFDIFTAGNLDIILTSVEDLILEESIAKIHLTLDAIDVTSGNVDIDPFTSSLKESATLSTAVKSSTTLHMRPDFTCGSPINDGVFYRYWDLPTSFDFDIIDATNAARVSASIKSEVANTFVPGVGDERRCWHMEVFMYKGGGVPAPYDCQTRDIPLFLEDWMLIDDITIYNDIYVRSEGGISYYEGSAFYEFPNTNKYFVIIPTRDLSKVSNTLYLKFKVDISYVSSKQQAEIK